MPAGTSPNLLAFALQNALQRAHPQPMPSNMVITLVAGPYAGNAVGQSRDVTAAAHSVAAETWSGGWVWGAGEYH